MDVKVPSAEHCKREHWWMGLVVLPESGGRAHLALFSHPLLPHHHNGNNGPCCAWLRTSKDNRYTTSSAAKLTRLPVMVWTIVCFDWKKKNWTDQQSIKFDINNNMVYLVFAEPLQILWGNREYSNSNRRLSPTMKMRTLRQSMVRPKRILPSGAWRTTTRQFTASPRTMVSIIKVLEC